MVHITSRGKCRLDMQGFALRERQGGELSIAMHQGVDAIMPDRHMILIEPSGVDGIPTRGSSVGANHDLGRKQQHGQRIASGFIVPSNDDDVLTLYTIGIAILTEKQTAPQTVPHAWNLGGKMSEPGRFQHAARAP